MNKSNYQFYTTKFSQRESACSLCKSTSGNLVGKMNYIGLGKYNVFQCPSCGLSSFDPIPSGEITGLGCKILYQIQQSSETQEKILRGFARSYRRGGHFARTYLTDFFNKSQKIKILEIGAGDGYFSQGIKAYFKNADISYVDIVEDLIIYYKEHFPEATSIAGEFTKDLFPNQKFDLVIARDLLEHLTNPDSFLKDTESILNNKGLFFFITPNGREDLWTCNQHLKQKNRELFLFLNHYHYYLPETIDKLLERYGLIKKVFFKFGLKHHRKGLGHKEINITETQNPTFAQSGDNLKLVSDYWRHDVSSIKRKILHNNKFISKLYSKIADKEKQKVNYYAPHGHEFFVIAQKEGSTLTL